MIDRQSCSLFSPSSPPLVQHIIFRSPTPCHLLLFICHLFQELVPRRFSIPLFFELNLRLAFRDDLSG
ncbi:hypothetical protein C6366_05885 [Desulfonatronum sp. SC1]|nr:hypothetical protein C6366_05885 [Desulfonatronum sp. SC1]